MPTIRPTLSVISLQNMLVNATMRSSCIRDATGWNEGRDTNYPEVYRGFPQSFRRTVGYAST
jgi:hypothetical protein